MITIMARDLPFVDVMPYIRSTDGARMIALAPGVFVNEAVWRVLGAKK